MLLTHSFALQHLSLFERLYDHSSASIYCLTCRLTLYKLSEMLGSFLIPPNGDRDSVMLYKVRKSEKKGQQKS